MIKKVLCAIGKHHYRYVGDDYKDKIYLCVRCGRRHVARYTLRINRLR